MKWLMGLFILLIVPALLMAGNNFSNAPYVGEPPDICISTIEYNADLTVCELPDAGFAYVCTPQTWDALAVEPDLILLGSYSSQRNYAIYVDQRGYYARSAPSLGTCGTLNNDTMATSIMTNLRTHPGYLEEPTVVARAGAS